MKTKIKKSILLSLTLIIAILIAGQFSRETYSFFESSEETNNLSIILMIGDGMGFEQVKLGRWVEKGITTNFTMENLHLKLNVSTVNIDGDTTDSAAAATAMATGKKVQNKVLSVDENGTILTTMLEIAQEMGKATGVVTTTSIQHATPAGFMTHVTSRYLTAEISRQIIEEANVDVLLGGGDSDFTVEQYLIMETNNYTIVRDKAALIAAPIGKLMGIFADGHLPYEQERDLALTPSLAQMTRKAIEILDQNSKGFFLMVEGGRIDHGGHANNQVNVALETIAFAKAVREAIAYVKSNENTILIITADHETGGLMVQSEKLDSTLPLFGYTEDQNRTIQITRANQITVEWSRTGHTSKPVPLFGYGNVFTSLENNILIDNTEIFRIMNGYFNGSLTQINSTTFEMKNRNITLLLLLPTITIFTISYRKLKRRKNQQVINK